MSDFTWNLEVGEDGLLTFPQELLDQLGWGEDTDLVWTIDEFGGITLERAPQDKPEQQGDS